MQLPANNMQGLVEYLLFNRNELPRHDWSVQGFGFLRLRVGPNLRLHVWDSRLRVPEVSDVHDHTQWSLSSTIIAGSLVNIRFKLNNIGEAGEPYKMATIKCGVGGGLTEEKPIEVRLLANTPELYIPGDIYIQNADEIHRTMAADGTVTLMRQFRSDKDTARVFWPVNAEWGNAEPRQATQSEIDNIGAFALKMFLKEKT